jgi:hypothetical protein
MDLTAFPGGDLVARGLEDLRAGRRTVESLLVQIGGPRLRACGLEVPKSADPPERALYDLLAAENPDAAHGRYNALVRRLVSFERALECANR